MEGRNRELAARPSIQPERSVDDGIWFFLCAFAPLREIFLIAAIIAAGSLAPNDARAGEGDVSEADQQMEAKLQAIADGVDGTFGLVVEDLAGEHWFAVNADRQFTQASCIKTTILL